MGRTVLVYFWQEVLTLADVWNIIDNLHTHFLDHEGEDAPILRMLEAWMIQTEDLAAKQ